MKEVVRGGQESCPLCGKEGQLYVLHDLSSGSKEEMCGNCLAEKLAEKRSKIFPATTCIPNFFDRQLLEQVLPSLEGVPDEVVARVADEIAYELSDEVSRLFFEEVGRYSDEYEALVNEAVKEIS